MKRILGVVVLAWAAAGCTCGTAPGLGARFACQQPADCADGWDCVGGECVLGDGGSADGGNGNGDGGVADAGCVPSGATEICNDGLDNDCDGLTDCQDPKCNHRACDTGHPAAVCCGTGASSSVCKDLSQDSSNCGACGATCGPRESCAPVTSGSILSGACTCSTSTRNNQCPNAETCGTVGWSSGTACSCATNAQCGDATCTATEGLGSPGFCHYP